MVFGAEGDSRHMEYKDFRSLLCSGGLQQFISIGGQPLHSASSLFSAIFVFQKSYTGNILGIGQNKSRTSYFSRT
jgi:hypothetical protein